MGLLRRLFKSRRYPRFFTHKRAFVVVKSDSLSKKKERTIQILDISEGGCAFIYDGTREELEESGILSLIADDNADLDRVDFVTAVDNPIPEPLNDTGLLRRRGVEFRWLGIFDRQRLKDFIKQNSIGRVP